MFQFSAAMKQTMPKLHALKQLPFYLLMILQSGLCSAGQFFGWSYRWALEWLNLVDRSSEDGTQLGCWNDWASPSAFGL